MGRRPGVQRFDTYMAPYIRASTALATNAVRQYPGAGAQPQRALALGTQTPFTNLTFDWTCPEDLREQVPVIAGRERCRCLRRPAG